MRKLFILVALLWMATPSPATLSAAARDCSQEQFMSECIAAQEDDFYTCAAFWCWGCRTYNYTGSVCHFDQDNCFTWSEFGDCTCGQCCGF
jgi:hypothetical protein